jgi:hypothetical protein
VQGEAARLAQASALTLCVEVLLLFLVFGRNGQGESRMQHVIEDSLKPRLTERVDILTAVNILRSRGYRNEDLIAEITRLFYVDLDEYNDVVQLSA